MNILRFGLKIIGRIWTTANYVIEPLATLSAGTATALMPDTFLYTFNGTVVPLLIGQPVNLNLRGREFRGTLRTADVKRRRARLTVRATLDDVTVAYGDGLSLPTLEVVANGVQVVPSVPALISAEGIELRGDLEVESLVSWLNGMGLDWEIRADVPAEEVAGDTSSMLVAYHRRRQIRAIVDASVTDDTVHIQVVRGSWRWLRIPRTKLAALAFPLAPLPQDVRVIHARRHGSTVRLVLDLPSVRTRIDLGQLRDAIVAGTRYVIP